MTPRTLRPLLLRLLAVGSAPLGASGCAASSAPASPAPLDGGRTGGEDAGREDAGDEDETSCATAGPAERCYAPADGAACLPPGDTAITDTSRGALLGGCLTAESEYCTREVASGPAPGAGGCCYVSSCTCCSSPFGRPLLVGARPRLAPVVRSGAWSGREGGQGPRAPGENEARRPLSLRPRGQPR